MKLKYSIFERLYHILICIGRPWRVFPVERTQRALLLDLISRLRPQNTRRGLIRLGGQGDGGYLVPDDLLGVIACFSPGVSTVSQFEGACAALGMNVYLADASVDGPAEANPRFHFVKKYVGACNSDHCMTICEWMKSVNLPEQGDLLLQMDIEGCEYETILSLSDEVLLRFRVIVIEFHHLRQLWNRPFFRLVRPAFEKLLSTHLCVHVHPNNSAPCLWSAGIGVPDVMEFTFLRRDRAEILGDATEFPHRLDRENTGKATLRLPRVWYGGGC